MSLSQLPLILCNHLKESAGELTDFRFAPGGCINHGGIISTKSDNYFLKWNQASKFPAMFELEKKGLELLDGAEGIRVPEIISTGEVDDFSYILLEYLRPSAPGNDFWENFATGLVKIHRSSNPQFGLNYDNYIGSLRQVNTFASSWSEFFIENRLLYQLKLGYDNSKISGSDAAKMEKIIVHLQDRIPEEKPALLHGDLWSGNLITGSNGEPCLIDPAVYYGHREMDLAMSQLFGGFDEEYISIYNEIFPLESNFKSRFDIWNLYPLLAHLNLFGGGYLGRVKEILKAIQ